MSADRPPDDSTAVEDLHARLELLEEENRRLRDAYRRASQTRYRRTAVGLALVGAVALAGAALFPAVRTVLVVLGATGAFAGLLTWYLTPERFVAAAVGERVYAPLAENESSLAAELGLGDRRRYVPLPGDPDRDAVLYLSQSDADELPSASALGARYVVSDDSAHRGLALVPTGAPLLDELRTATAGGLAAAPDALVEQLADGLREQFELIDAAVTDVSTSDGRASVAVTGSAFGDLDRFDHPVGSLLATGLAAELETPVELRVDRTPDGRGEFLVRATWTPSDAGGESRPREPDTAR